MASARFARRAPRRGARTIGTAALIVLALVAAPGTANPATPRPVTARRTVALEQVASVTGTTALASRPGDRAVYVTTQHGEVLRLGRARPTTVLDLTGLTRASGERGLLGLAFAPDGLHLYVHYTGVNAGETVLEEYRIVDGAPDPATRRVVLTVPQPQANHNGGQVAFGPDGLLYLGLGDGGGRDDRGAGHAPEGNGQSRDTLLGKILRIDPRPSGSRPYSVPTDNPFASGGGRPEIYVSGLRNPWRFSFDTRNGDLWIADVGQDAWEEVTRLPAGSIAGANLGWPLYEASHRFRAGPPTDVVMPQIETSHDDGNCSVTGGYVYRGSAIPWLRGWYVFSDYCNGTIVAARIRADGTVRMRDLGVELPSISSFGTDRTGELYVLSQPRGVFRIVPA